MSENVCEQGDLYDHDGLVKAIKQVDVVISTVGFTQIADQTKIIAAIKEAGNVKVGWFHFLPHPHTSSLQPSADYIFLRKLAVLRLF